MASTQSQIQIIFQGQVDNLVAASRAAEARLKAFQQQSEGVDRSLTRIFTGGTKAAAGLGALGNAVPLLAGLAGSATTAAGALLVLPGAALVGAAALTTLKLATNGVGDAMSAAISGDAKAYAEAVGGLAPEARATADAVRTLAPELRALQQEVQNRAFAGFATDVRDLGRTYLPVLRPQLAAIAGDYNAMGREAAKALLAPEAVASVNTVLGVTHGVLGDMRPALGNVLTGILAIGGEGALEMRGFGEAVTDATTRFREWATAAAESGRITELIREGKEELADYGTVAGNVGGILEAVFEGLSQGGYDFSTSLVESTQALEDFLNTAEGQEALQALGETLGVTADVVRDVLLTALRELGPVIVEAAPAAQEFARVLGGLLVDAIQTVGPLLQSFARFLSENREVIGNVLPLLAGLVLGFKALSILTTVAGWVTGAIATFGKLTAFLLGPWGIALLAAATAVGVLLARQNEAADAARDHESAVAGLKGTLDEYTGSVTEATSAHVADELASRKLADGTTLLRDALRNAGISFQDYASAALGNEEALARVNAKLVEQAVALPELREEYEAGNGILGRYGITMEEFAGYAVRGRVGIEELNRRLAEAGATFQFSGESIDEMTGPLGELGGLLGEYNGTLREAQEQTRLAAGVSADFTTVLGAVQAGLAGLKDGAAPLPPMVEAFRSLGASAQEAAMGAGRAAAEFGGVEAGAEAARKSMESSREAFVSAAEGALGSREAAEALADSIGLIPEAAETQFRTNATGVAAELQELAALIEKTPDAKTITLNSNSPELIESLKALGFEVKELPNGQIEITLEDDEARRKLEAFTKTISTTRAAPQLDLETSTAEQRADAMIEYINGLVGIAQADADAAPGTAKADELKRYIDGITGILAVDGNPAPGTEKANQLQEYINGLVGVLTADADNAPGKEKGDALREYINGLLGVMTADADTQPGRREADALRDYVNGLRGAITVSAETSAAERDINHTARDRTSTIRVTVRYNDPGPPIQVAGGGVVPGFAGGGVIGGYAPGRDTVRALLSPGEAVLVPELTRAIGPRNILAANYAASGRPSAQWNPNGGVARFAGGGIAAARQYLIDGLASNAPQPPASPAPPAPTPVAVRVFIGDRELTDLVRTEVDNNSRSVARVVRAGGGVSW
ncbi:hypothetical protein ACU61A_15705 [Pseudonocardia sichuanensis]